VLEEAPDGARAASCAGFVAPAVSRDVAAYLDEVGKCVAREVVSVQPQISGRILEIHFEMGRT